MILNKIAKQTAIRVAKEKLSISKEEMVERAHEKKREKSVVSFEDNLRKEGMSFICEVKKASPSKGLIAKEFPYLEIAKEYEEAGASAISVLTEPDFFMGENRYLEEIASEVQIPVLRKEFIIDPYQIYQAKTIGASAVLLICALLDTDKLSEYLELCESLSLSALVEAHDEVEIESALKAGARIVGVNNRDLKTFEVDINNGLRLRKLVPDSVLFIAESGIQTADDVKVLADAKVDGVLIGETLMRAADKKAELDKLRGKLL